MFTVSDLLKLPDVSGLRLVAGADGVGREISRTNIMDNPDTFDWLISGEFLLSTGYIFPESDELRRGIVRKLAEIGCSGLGLKVRRYLDGIPACMIEEAEALHIPLIELPFGNSLSDVSSAINKHIYRQEEGRIEQALSIHRELTRASLRSGGLYEIARIAVGFLENPILIFDSNWRLLSWEDCAKNPFPVAKSISTKRKTTVLPKEFTDSMPSSLDMFRKPITRRLHLQDDQQVICRVMPVAANESSLYGYIVVWETVHTLDMADHIALEQVAVSVAIERLRAKEIDEIKIRIKRDFFDDLLSGNIESLSAMRSLAELHGLNADSRYRCLLVRYAVGSSETKLLNQEQLNAQSKLCAEVCARTAADYQLPVVVVQRSMQTILLAEIPPGSQGDSARPYALSLYEALSAHFLPQALLVVVDVTAGITEISEAFADVQQTLRLLRDSRGEQTVVFVEDYSVSHLLDKHIEKPHLLQFSQKSLGALIAYDRDNNTQLLQTLDMYFTFSGNITEAAKHMYIHRNTYIYRLSKVKSILGDNFASPLKLLEYQIALLALKLAGN